MCNQRVAPTIKECNYYIANYWCFDLNRWPHFVDSHDSRYPFLLKFRCKWPLVFPRPPFHSFSFNTFRSTHFQPKDLSALNIPITTYGRTFARNSCIMSEQSTLYEYFISWGKLKTSSCFTHKRIEIRVGLIARGCNTYLQQVHVGGVYYLPYFFVYKPWHTRRLQSVEQRYSK